MAILTESQFARGVIMGPFSASKQSPYEESAAQKYELGTKWVYGDGRIFRYAKNGGVALGKAKMTQTQVVETKLLEVAQTAHAQAAGVRDITVLVTTGSALAENALAGGTLWANKINQLGDSYRIVASKLQSTDTLLDLKLETPIRTALLATTELSIAPNKYYGVVVFPTTTTGSPTGVPLIDVSIGYYFWSQTGGDAPLYVDSGETAVIGNLVGPPGTYAVPGAGGVWVTLTCPWGSWRTVNAADEVGLVDLWLDR